VPGPPTLLPASGASRGRPSVRGYGPAGSQPRRPCHPGGPRALRRSLSSGQRSTSSPRQRTPASPSLTSCSLTLDGETPSSPMGVAAGETPAALWATARILSRAARAAPRNRPRLPPGIAAPAMGETGAGAVGRRRPTPTVLADGGLPHEVGGACAGGGWPHGAEAPALVQGTFKMWLGLSF
jgi:hypothetical protein